MNAVRPEVALCEYWLYICWVHVPMCPAELPLLLLLLFVVSSLRLFLGCRCSERELLLVGMNVCAGMQGKLYGRRIPWSFT